MQTALWLLLGLQINHLTIGVWVDLCKGPQGETDVVLRAGEAHISKKGRHHQVLICGICTEREETLPITASSILICPNGSLVKRP